jgi:NTE family protein
MKRIGLALSGGGIRAAIFHLGVLKRLADSGKWENIASVSSVSGASLCMGTIFAVAGNAWPTQKGFTAHVLPRVRELFLHEDIQAAALLRLPLYPQFWRNRVELLAKMLEKKWGIRGTLQDLPARPFWEINCTTFETGNRFRMRRDFMGECATGYVAHPTMPISHMIAASSAFPVLIGPYKLRTKGLKFTQDKAGKGDKMSVPRCYSLWDGGVYDNLGLTALHRVGHGLDREIDYLIVSNAGATMHDAKRGRPSKNLRRLLAIAANQAEQLRAADFKATIEHAQKGVLLRISGEAASYPTTLSAPKAKDFDMIFGCGYAAATRALVRHLV